MHFEVWGYFLIWTKKKLYFFFEIFLDIYFFMRSEHLPTFAKFKYMIEAPFGS